jgi:hypothetical protein
MSAMIESVPLQLAAKPNCRAASGGMSLERNPLNTQFKFLCYQSSAPRQNIVPMIAHPWLSFNYDFVMHTTSQQL